MTTTSLFSCLITTHSPHNCTSTVRTVLTPYPDFIAIDIDIDIPIPIT